MTRLSQSTLMRSMSVCLTLAAAAVGAQSLDSLKNDASTPGDVTTYGMNWGQQRHLSR